MKKSELLSVIKTKNLKCRFRMGTLGEIQKCKDVDSHGYGYFNLDDDYNDNLCCKDHRFDIVEIYC